MRGRVELIGARPLTSSQPHPPYASIIPIAMTVRATSQACTTSPNSQDEMRRHGACASSGRESIAPSSWVIHGEQHFIPITLRVLMSFLEAGFILREDIIKIQWKMKSTREKWFGKKYDFSR